MENEGVTGYVRSALLTTLLGQVNRLKNFDFDWPAFMECRQNSQFLVQV